MDSLVNGSKEAERLPHDHHELVALVAPRAFLVLPGDPGNAHLGANSAYRSFMAARQVWAAMGASDRAGLVTHQPGGSHCSASSAQTEAAQRFIERFLEGRDVDTDIVEGTDDDWQAVVDWSTPTIEGASNDSEQGARRSTLGSAAETPLERPEFGPRAK